MLFVAMAPRLRNRKAVLVDTRQRLNLGPGRRMWS
jgi:hypothetical protein